VRVAGELLDQLMQGDVLRQLAVSDSGFLFDPRSGQSYTLNPSGLEALEMLRLGLTPVQVAQELSRRYEVNPEQAETCLESFIRQLGRYLT